MSRISLLSSPLLLGFEEIERLIDRANKGSSDGYPPYNVERVDASNGEGDTLRITLAVAGFTRDQLEITLADSQLTVLASRPKRRRVITSIAALRRDNLPAPSCLRRESR